MHPSNVNDFNKSRKLLEKIAHLLILFYCCHTIVLKVSRSVLAERSKIKLLKTEVAEFSFFILHHSHVKLCELMNGHLSKFLNTTPCFANKSTKLLSETNFFGLFFLY